MTTEVSPQSRVQILDNPPVAPGVCVLCGTAGIDNRKFIDFGKQVEWYGAVYFCSECFGEAARAVGFIPVIEFDQLLTDLKTTNARSKSIELQNKRLINALSIIFVELGRSSESVDSYIDNLLASVSEPEQSEGTNENSATGEPETDESDSVEGPDDLFDDSDFE